MKKPGVINFGKCTHESLGILYSAHIKSFFRHYTIYQNNYGLMPVTLKVQAY